MICKPDSLAPAKRKSQEGETANPRVLNGSFRSDDYPIPMTAREARILLLQLVDPLIFFADYSKFIRSWGMRGGQNKALVARFEGSEKAKTEPIFVLG
jgi:hypothetical protein